MKKLRWGALAGLALLGWSSGWAHAGGWSVGVRVGVPGYYGPGWYGYSPYYYRPYPVVVAPPPVYYTPAPVVVQAAPAVVPQPAPAVVPQPATAPPAYEAPAPRPLAVQPAAREVRTESADGYLQLLRSSDDNVRLDSVTQLGRLQDQRAIDPLAATLAGDASPAVREAAARALALIGSPRALLALRQAAQNDRDRDVRHSAQFAIDVIQAKR
jgi:hypothetical protein